MGQEYFINDQTLENKVRELLPSQGGKGAGFDLSASTQIIPIVDLTESAEGSNVRQDLQTAFSFDNTNEFEVSNTNSDIITNTGYYRVIGCANIVTSTSANSQVRFRLGDGATEKSIYNYFTTATSSVLLFKEPFDFTIFIDAGDKLVCTASANCFAIGAFRQIATIDGTLV
tara:strand:- start:355 stop:870 length:516 start_codon:yes stop_codon:yes gene_type:complete